MRRSSPSRTQRIVAWLRGPASADLARYEEHHEERHDREAEAFLRRQEYVRKRLIRLEELMDTRTARKREGNRNGRD